MALLRSLANPLFLMLLPFLVHAQAGRTSLKDLSSQINKSLPEVIDRMTKIQRTTVENNNVVYHVLVDASHKEYDFTIDKVKNQVLKGACKNRWQKSILKDHKTNIVYRYENTKGQSLGQFMIKPEQCK